MRTKLLYHLLAIAVLCCGVHMGWAQVITTVAGTGISGTTGDGGPATAAKIMHCGAIAFDGLGNYYIAVDNHTIRKITSSGIISTVAGTGVAGYNSDGILATNAKLNLPAVASDFWGNLFIADFGNNRVRKVNVTTGIISTIAGTGVAGFSGDGGSATAAELWHPNYVTLDKVGNVYTSEANNYRIRKIGTDGLISTVAGNGVGGFSGDGGQATTAPIWVNGIHFDTSDNLYIASLQAVRKVNMNTGIITTVAGDTTVGYSGDAGPATNAKMWFALDVIPDNCGNIFISETYNNVIRQVDNLGIIHTIAGTTVGGYNGDNISATSAQINSPRGIAIDATGNLYIADNGNLRIRRVSPVTSCGVLSPPLDVNLVGTSGTFSIFPNPATTTLNITAPTPITHISITNLPGTQLLTQTCNTLKAEINVAGLPPGMYLLRVTDAAGNQTIKKILKE